MSLYHINNSTCSLLKLIATGLFLINMNNEVSGQNLLFKSGFENEVVIEEPIPVNGKWYQLITGTDNETNYEWPTDFTTVTPTDAYWTFKVPDTETLSDYAEVKIMPVTGPNGYSTNALSMRIKNYDPTNFDNSMQGHVRCEYRLNLDTTLSQAYIKYWIKFQPDLYDIMRFGTGRWRMIMEWFESGENFADYRWSLHIRTARGIDDSSSVFWRLSKQFVNGPGNPGDFVTDTVVSVTNFTPPGEWVKIELFWKQSTDSDGRIWFSVNDKEIIDLLGANLRDTHIRNWQIFKLYTDEPSMDDGEVYQLIDDVEIWDDFPDITSVDDENKVPKGFKLYQNYPNPFNPTTKIKFTLTLSEKVSLKVYDILGREVKTLINQHMQPGEHEIKFDGRDLPSGVYVYQLRSKNFITTNKMVLLR